MMPSNANHIHIHFLGKTEIAQICGKTGVFSPQNKRHLPLVVLIFSSFMRLPRH
jgi:hypothetical protein